MKRILLTALLASVCVGASAQSPGIRTERLENKTVEFFLEGKTRPGTMTVFLMFDNLTNCNSVSGTVKREAKFTGTRLLSLRPADESMGVGYSYKTYFFNGPVDKRVDTTFVYRMPTTVRWRPASRAA